MFRLTCSALALGGSKASQFNRSIVTQSFKQHELRQEESSNEEATQEEVLDEFTKEFLGNQIKVSFASFLLFIASLLIEIQGD